jgi:hypothetical protein
MLIALISMRMFALTPTASIRARPMMSAAFLAASSLLAFALSFVSPKIALSAFALNFAQPMIERWRRRKAARASAD